MKAELIRKTFFDFFADKQHHIVPSAPMVVHNDPSLMFTNAGMNQFKDIFLGHAPASHLRVANTQKCLRVSGKHNDLEEVGHDTYHHTMFEMLGNWSFGDYFKKEAIAWAWELLTEAFKLEKDRLYVTVFEGDPADGLEPDMESYALWEAFVPGDRILYGSKKDNFWEMGEIGPCGPCSEIHIDLRTDSEREKVSGHSLVNQDHPQVIEIWNLVFIEFNRQKDGKLKNLPARHVDTGMGFERLCMALQGKRSNYDTDVFQPYIKKLSELAGKAYGEQPDTDIAMRVIADHLRAVAFAIADGELPSNNKAGYVIRRILRRAIRYGYTFLGFREPFVCLLVAELARHMGEAFPELKAQRELIEKVIREEEASFLRTLALGIQKFEHHLEAHADNKLIDGQFAFELFDTYGFPPDLTRLMAREQGWDVDMQGFDRCMEEQKNRSRQVAAIDTQDWVELFPMKEETRFLGYDSLEARVAVSRYRRVKQKDKVFYQLVLDQTPFYAESGGQAGDRGELLFGDEVIPVTDTRRENNLVVHITSRLPNHFTESVMARVDAEKRLLTANNHTATHLLHAVLKEVLGAHVQQKGSLVDEERLRFDFSHFSKLTDEELTNVEMLVNEKIRQNIPAEEKRDMKMEEAINMGATALFGEKYGEKVRVVAFDPSFSAELCGGTHASYTGQIGLFKIVSEGAIAAGIRRVEAITGKKAERLLHQKLTELEQLKGMLKNPKDSVRALQQLLEQNDMLRKQMDLFQKERMSHLAEDLTRKAEQRSGLSFVSAKLKLDAKAAKDLAFAVKGKLDHFLMVLGYEEEEKAGIIVMVSESVAAEKDLHAGNLVRDLATHINGGGGGQPFFATAGGKNTDGLDKVMQESKKIFERITS